MTALLALLGSLLLLTPSSVSALNATQWRAQSVYQVLTDRFALVNGSTTAPCSLNQYCGGSWQAIVQHLDYIQGMGFTAIWISPIVENLAQVTNDGAAYHGYWAQNIYALNSNFGTPADLQYLASELHNRGMYLMVDVVTNHMGYDGCGDCVDYADFNPFNDESYFHPFCLIDYNNATSIQVCWEGDNTVALADLRTENSNVYDVFNSWITDLVQDYSIDGLRVDSMQQVDQAFWPPFQSAAGVYAVGEVFNGNPSYTCPYQQYLSGVLNYPMFFYITQAFESTSGSISNLVNGVNDMKSTCADTTLLGSFLENHDNPRFPSITQDMSLAKNAIAFAILADGIPIVYEGQEQHLDGGNVPDNREAIWSSSNGYSTSAPLYTFIAQINAIRTRAIAKDSGYLTYKAYPVYSDSSTIVMRKGFTQIIGVFSNLGANGASYTLSLPSSDTGFSNSQSLVEILTCTSYSTDSSGNLAVPMASGLPRIFYPASALTGSGICSNIPADKAPASTLSTASCASPTAVAVTFKDFVTTTYGQNVKVVGSVSQLGSWNTANAVALSAANYSSSNNVWFGSVALTPGQVVQWKAIEVGSNGDVTWEADPNHTFTVSAAKACATTTTVTAAWQH